MSTPMSPRDHALRVAVLDVLADEVNGAYKAARSEAQPVFAEVREDGQTQQKALLPDGTEIGLISIRGGGKTVTPDEGAIFTWMEEHNTEGIEDYIIPQAVSSADVIALVKAYYPEAVASRVRGPVREALLKEAKDNGGYAIDHASGEKAKIAEVADGKPTGAFAWRAGPEAREKVIAAWRAGQLEGLPLGPLALPAADTGKQEAPEPETDDALNLGPFGDNLGFYDPVRAAMHAVVVQGGYTTPPIEAYRMIRDGGAMRVRALAWLAAQGLDPEDPREGKDTPWPLNRETEGRPET